MTLPPKEVLDRREARLCAFEELQEADDAARSAAARAAHLDSEMRTARADAMAAANRLMVARRVLDFVLACDDDHVDFSLIRERAALPPSPSPAVPEPPVRKSQPADFAILDEARRVVDERDP